MVYSSYFFFNVGFTYHIASCNKVDPQTLAASSFPLAFPLRSQQWWLKRKSLCLLKQQMLRSVNLNKLKHPLKMHWDFNGAKYGMYGKIGDRFPDWADTGKSL